ncbi:DUF4294 domain-containing protein [Flavobacterium rhizosphaerae]|uniref:DUF4294 domain-containing protein n=1 Tax=Flavobacterium rhizosphaerae TaxID=3163298 RepID=A0ABW8YUN4_9FLAO
MDKRIYILLLLFTLFSARGQVVDNDSIVNDSIVFNMQLDEIVISNVKDSLTDEEKKQLWLLRRRVLKVYPYAKIAAEKLTMLNANMAKLKSKKEKKKYAKIIENYLEDEFEGQLKKLTRKEGQILVKLIYRQTGSSTYDLIKEHKSGFRAYMSDRMAHLFNIDLKTTYHPDRVPEDYNIEGILLKAFNDRRLQRQEPAFAIDYDAITKAWIAKNENGR